MIKLNPVLIDLVVPFHATHIVNVTMGLKHPALNYYFMGSDVDRENAKNGIRDLIKHHGVVSGCINGDEHLAGNSPTAGSELCSVVEYLFSLQSLMEIFGESYYADLTERLAYNALPATITEDFMAHQYLQQANQVLVTDAKRPWFNNESDANIFGLEPNFGCCTANMHQGWPRFVNSLWYRQGDNILVNLVFAPNILTTQVQEQEICIEVVTDYPFREKLVYRFEKTPSTPLEIKIRIPEWCTSPQIQCTGADINQENNFICVKKIFTKGEEIDITFPMEIQYTTWNNDSIALERGPLVYGLEIEEDWRVIKEISGVKDYEVYPKSEWNFAISSKNDVVVEELPLTDIPFSKMSPPLRLQTNGKKVDGWNIVENSAGKTPKSPVASNSKEESISLIPFGCTKLRISQFPTYLKD